jgi:hypothetical protein
VGEYGVVNAILSRDNPASSLFFLDFLNDNVKIGKGLVSLQRAQALYSNPLIRIGLKGIAPFFRSITWCHGPLISEPVYQAEAIEYFLNWVEILAKKTGAFAVEGATSPAYFNNYVDAGNEIYEKFGYSKMPMATVALELDRFKTKDDCWKNTAEDARTKVKKALKDGIEIIEDTKLEFLSDFIELHRKSGYPNLPFYKDESLFKRVANIYNSGNMCRLFVSRKDGRILSGQVLFTFNQAIVLEGVIISDIVRKNRWYANDLMQWYIISWAKENNFRIIDWGGFSLFPTKKEEQINNFKLKWGGSVCRFYAYSKSFISWKYDFLNFLKKLKGNRNT